MRLIEQPRSVIRLTIFSVLVFGAACSDNLTSSIGTSAADESPGEAIAGEAITRETATANIATDAGPDQPPPAMDGLFGEWKDVPILATDPPGDATGSFDLTTLKATSSGTTVYLYFDVGTTLNAPAGPTTDGTLRIMLTPSSGTRTTVDLRGRKAWLGATPGTEVKWSELDYMLAPTYASKTFEGRINLARAGAKIGDTVTLDFGGSDRLGNPVSLKLSAPAHSSHVRSTVRAAGTTLRVASLNTSFDGLTDPVRGTKMGRLLKAVSADIYCFQEVFDGSASTISSLLTALNPCGDNALWSATMVGDTVIATRGTIVPVPAQSTSQRHVAAGIEVAGSSLVLFNVQLRCCGHIGHSHDASRIAEVKQVAATIKKLRDGTLGADLMRWKQAPAVVMGDWNMVGSRTPLDVMLNSVTGPGLSQYMPRHLKGDDVFTWYRDELDEFPPGVLDLLVHSQELTPVGGYVLDTAELDSATLAKLGLRAHDSAASDHLLLVADMRF